MGCTLVVVCMHTPKVLEVNGIRIFPTIREVANKGLFIFQCAFFQKLKTLRDEQRQQKRGFIFRGFV